MERSRVSRWKLIWDAPERARPDARVGNPIAPGIRLRDGANGGFRDRGPSGLSGDRVRQFLDLYEARRIQRNADAVRLVAQHQREEPAQSLGALVWPPRTVWMFTHTR